MPTNDGAALLLVQGSLQLGPCELTKTKSPITMKKHFLLGLLGLCASLGAAQAAVVATGTYNGKEYLLVSPNSWSGAQAEAVTLGGNLVTLDDAAEDAWVFGAFESYWGTGQYGGWIGYNDTASEGVFSWVSGESSSYTNWNIGEPNQAGDEDGVHYWPNGAWNDLNVDNRLYGIVERPIRNGVPEGGAGLALLGIALGGLGLLKRRMQ